MCGIFGVVRAADARVTDQQVRKVTDDLLCFSSARGKESSGVAVYRADGLSVYKVPHESTRLVRDRTYRSLLAAHEPIRALVGHARLVTNGDESNMHNNQPVIKQGLVGVHNGIIVNDRELWQQHPDLERSYDVDTEALLALVRTYGQQMPYPAALARVLREIRGTASVGILGDDLTSLLLATNNGSLYTMNRDGVTIFASERSFLRRLLRAHPFLPHREEDIARAAIAHVGVVDLASGTLTWQTTDTKAQSKPAPAPGERVPVSDLSAHTHTNARSNESPDQGFLGACSEEYERNRAAIARLQRCTRCILPETMPFISYDDAGVCNYCRGYQKHTPQGVESLRAVADSIRSPDGSPDCLVTFSGGRDSSYGLHYLVRELGLHPITYSYDWGMISDIARRNQARMCGQLGLENIVVSADIRRKRENIRKNVEAWFKKPDLGMIPLFMAGDKQFFYYANQVQKQTGVPKIVLSINPLERTDFKSGFSGVAPNFMTGGEGLFYRLSGKQGFTMLAFYLKNYLSNPAYLNSSMIDTALAYASYYLIQHDYLHLYDHIPWDERVVDDVLINEYDWEVASDSTTTWRIGDATAPFYNYIYYTLAGFTENDTFRSNQIREGAIDREEALRRSTIENQPRFESFVWYCNTIRIDYKKALDTIHAIPKLYAGK